MSTQSIPPVPASLAAKLAELANLDVIAGVAVTVVRDGAAAGFWSAGHASLPFRVPVAESTLFHVGSVGKHVTALAVLQLVDAGRVDLGTALGAYVPGLPSAWAAIPVRSLLDHTSGLPDYGAVIKDWDRPQGRDLVIDAIGTRAPLFAPRAAWAYSNTNYLALGWLIEAVSGESYPDYLRHRLFGPAALPTAREGGGQDVIPHRAEAYEFRDGRFAHAVQIERSVAAAADGGVLFSARDVAPWAAALAGNRLVSAPLMAAAVTPARLVTGRPVPYGFGWFLDRTRGHDMQRHAGRVPGYGAFLMHLPAQALWVAVMTNTTPPAPLLLMALTTAEAYAPGSTFLSLPTAAAGRDPLTLRAREVLERGDAPANPAWFAPEIEVLMRARLAAVPPALPSGMRFDRLEPIESYAVDGGRMVRYRATLAGHITHYLFGWAEDERIFWAS
ncbi:MAG TPA: serine hydrolase domain-containing protein [Xanthobacteraceae bacterium]|jgi:CubicO group peptidase (beta-lactamase class C family)